MNKKIKAIGTRAQRIWKRIVVRTPQNPHHAFRMTRPRMIRLTREDLKATWRLIAESWRTILRHKWIYGGLGLLYAVLAYVLVGGISQVDYVTFKDATTNIMNGDVGALGTAFSLFGAAITGGLNTQGGSLQQFLSAALMLIFWLAMLWATRMIMADKEITIRDALYNSASPIVPTLVVLAAIALQLLPGAAGLFVYAIAVNGGWLTGGVESMIFAVSVGLLVLLSLYFVVSSLTAMVIVSLPGTYPWQALRVARELVMNRRWAVVLRMLTAVAFVLLLWAVVLMPVFLLDNWLRFDWLPLVPIAVQVMAGFSLVFTSVYIYKLYRSLL